MSILLKNCLLHRTLRSLTLTRLAQQWIKEKSISTNSHIGFYLLDAIRHCKNINTKLFIHPHLSKSQRQKMGEKFQLKGGYIRSKFGYTEVISNYCLDLSGNRI